MKKINQIPMSRILSTGTQPTGDTTSHLSEKDVVNHVVKRLKKARPAWRQGFKSNQDVNDWREELLQNCIDHRINSMELINKGLKEAGRDTNPFFPPVGQFIDWCLVEKEHYEHRRMLKIEEDRKKMKALPVLKATKETAQSNIDKMRDLINRGEV